MIAERIKCELCNSTFSNSGNLFAHIRCVHKIEIAEYQKQFSTKECLCGCGTKILAFREYADGHKLKGRKLSEETKRKISEGHKGRKCSDEFKRKCSERERAKFKNGVHTFQINREKITKLAKEAMIEKYGVDNPSMVREIKQKQVQTRKARYSHWMGNLTEEELIKFSERCKEAGKIGGRITADWWKKNPEKFKQFLEKGHEAQHLSGRYERMKTDNPMFDPDIKRKHREAVLAFASDPAIKQKRRDTFMEKYGIPYAPNLAKGENHYRWKGGISFSRGKDWEEIRRKIMERDNNSCIVCNQPVDLLHVHHIIPIRSNLPLSFLNTRTNLVSLCVPHHMSNEWMGIYDEIINDYLTKIYGKDEMERWERKKEEIFKKYQYGDFEQKTGKGVKRGLIY